MRKAEIFANGRESTRMKNQVFRVQFSVVHHPPGGLTKPSTASSFAGICARHSRVCVFERLCGRFELRIRS